MRHQGKWKSERDWRRRRWKTILWHETEWEGELFVLLMSLSFLLQWVRVCLLISPSITLFSNLFLRCLSSCASSWYKRSSHAPHRLLWQWIPVRREAKRREMSVRETPADFEVLWKHWGSEWLEAGFREKPFSSQKGLTLISFLSDCDWLAGKNSLLTTSCDGERSYCKVTQAPF